MEQNKIYTFANWGDKVWVDRGDGDYRKAVITEFDNSDERNTKVVYKNGGFDWYNRDEVEESSAFIERREIEVRDSER